MPRPAHPPLPALAADMPATPAGYRACLVAVVPTGRPAGCREMPAHGWLWLDRRYTEAATARRDAGLAVRSDLASLACVVAVEEDGTMRVMPSAIYPLAAKRVIDHYEHLWGLVQGPDQEK